MYSIYVKYNLLCNNESELFGCFDHLLFSANCTFSVVSSLKNRTKMLILFKHIILIAFCSYKAVCSKTNNLNNKI